MYNLYRDLWPSEMNTQGEYYMKTKKGSYFGIVDYIVFTSMLIISALLGAWYGCRSRLFDRYKELTLKDYLTGGGTMGAFPVAMSLVASYISAVTLLGTPSEIYIFGTQYWYVIIGIMMSGLVVAMVYLPVFVRLRVCSSYQYLDMRFHTSVRILASVYFVFDEIMFLPILVYVPALAFSQVSGINVYLVGTVVTIICVFYTVLGGLKAVVYTDTLQILVMFLSMIVVLIVGTIYERGPINVFQRSNEGERMQWPDFSPNLYDRYTIWSVVLGGFFYWTCFNSVNQTMVQRYLSMPTERSAQYALMIFSVGAVLIVSMCCFTGLLIYSTYYTCDPKMAGRILADDQILPLFVMDVAGHLMGIPGLFIAGVFGAALSSLSVALNSTALVILEDFLRGLFHLNISEKTGKFICKLTTLILGVISVALLFVVAQLGGIFAVCSSLSSIASGTSWGMFSLGMLVPWCNTKGCIVGAICGSLMAALVSFGNQYTTGLKMVVEERLPISIRNCSEAYGIDINSTVIEYPDQSGVFPLFKMSYFWVTPVSMFTVIFVGVIVSWITGFTDVKTLDPDLLSPVVQWMLPAEAKNFKGTAIKERDARILQDSQGQST